MRAARNTGRSRVPGGRGLLALVLLGGPAAAQEPVSLEELVQIARARSERQRPEQIEKLQPFLEELELDYRDNREFLDKRFEEIAELGDSIVPLLLDMLSPANEGDPAARNRAANTARVLLHLDPSGFVDALLEIATGKNFTGSYHAIWLLGRSRSRRAARVLAGMLDRLGRKHRIRAIEALTELDTPVAAARVAGYLASDDRRLREAAIRYLIGCRARTAVEPVLRALAAEKSPDLILRYVRYLEIAAPDDDKAAAAVQPLLHSDILDHQQITAVCRALATIAPEDHEATIASCRRYLEAGETGALGRACAMTMRSLGDSSGVRLLLERLRTHIAHDRRNSSGYIRRGDAFMELGRWAQAVEDYEDAIRLSSRRSVKELLYLLVARCEARRRDRYHRVLHALKEARVSHATLMKEAAADPALEEALQHPTLRRWVESLPRDRK